MRWRKWSGLRTSSDDGGDAETRRPDGEDGVGFVEGEDESFAAQAVPGDERFPEPEPVQSGMRAVKQIDHRPVGDKVFA